jgi:outer membrane biosynthesis protein TonB
MNNQQLSLATDGAKPQQAQPDTKPSPPPKPAATAAATPTQAPSATATPVPATTPEADQFAMLTATPPPPLKAPEEAEPSPPPEVAATPPPQPPRPTPQRAAADYRKQQEQTRISGRLTNRGPSSVNAVGTPLGRYQKAVSDAIGSRWYYYMKSKMDLVNIGTAHVEAEVDAEGHVQNLRVLSNNANEAFANICLQSFQEAKLPPIPPDLAAALPGGKMPIDFYFTTYSN